MTSINISKMTGTASPRSRTRSRSDWIILALVCTSQFMVILDAAIVNVALPSIRRDLGFTPTGLAWVVDGYLLTFGGLMLLGGRAADLFGQSRMLVAGLLLFSASSLAGGLAPTPTVLVAARTTQGMGAAMLAPATLAVINTAFTEPHARARAFGAWSAAGGVGGMTGAIAGGALTTALSWRWVFLINVPIGGALIAIALISLAGTRTHRRQSLDLTGAVTGTAGLAALIYGVMQSADHGWSSMEVLGPVVAGVLLLIVFAVIEARFATQPIVPPRLFGIRTVAAGNSMLLLFGAITIAMWYFTSLFLQNVLGYSALHAGLGQTPAAVTFVLIARFAASLMPRTGVRPLVLAGSAFFLGGFGWLTQAGAGTGYITGILGPTLLIATGIGLTFPTLMATVTAEATEGDVGIIGGLASTSFQVGQSIGLAALATAASATTAMHARGTSPGGLAAGYDQVFLIAAGVALAIAAVSRLLPQTRGAARHRAPKRKMMRTPTRNKVLLRDEQSDSAVSIVESTMPAGAPGPPLHSHAFDEAFYVLAGELTFQLGEEQTTATAGELVFAPRGIPHTVANLTNAPAGYLLVLTPAGFEREFARRAAQEAGTAPPDWARQPIPEVSYLGPRIKNYH